MENEIIIRAPIPLVGAGRQRLEILFQGSIQGVGFRPFLHRLASELGLAGTVRNSPQGVTLEVEGPSDTLALFLQRLPCELPPLASLRSFDSRVLPLKAGTGFQILDSGLEGPSTTEALPDAVVCPDCLREIFDPSDRRYRYPFTNCTHCGPRFSILKGLPYDRARTTMAAFPMCDACRAEYEDPRDRRFHAQPIACPECGPQLALWNGRGTPTAGGHRALLEAAWALRAGLIVAFKGLGGFQLLCDARDPEVVAKLRLRKHREEKPFAVMFPSIESIRKDCETSELEESILRSPAGPIVILRRQAAGLGREPSSLTRGLAPGNPNLGVLLPTTPLHALLLQELGFPIVATSGNLSDEPMVTDEEEAVKRLGGLADVFLVHDRPIARALDDSVVRVMGGRSMVLRRARGYAPRSVYLPENGSSIPILAVGAHLKNAVAILQGNRLVLGPHLGDLESPRASEAFQSAIRDLPTLFGANPEVVACDAHPDYVSTRAAAGLGRPVVPVQHHEAHVAACAAENGVMGQALGVAWDGTGWGADGTVWGGEFFTGARGAWTRRGRLRPFRLPGGESAVKEPRRSALGLLHAWGGVDAVNRPDLWPVTAFPSEERKILLNMLESGFNSPLTSSMGRLFDAVASLLGLRQKIRFEGQAAMDLEFLAGDLPSNVQGYPMLWTEKEGMGQLDWGPLVEGLIIDMANKVSPKEMAQKFHGSLVEGVIKAAESLGQNRVLLGGGCFQNKVLLDSCVHRLRAAGLEVYWPREIPPNDGGLALGQAVVARARLEGGTKCA